MVNISHKPTSLSHEARIFLLVQFLYALGTAFSGIFINLFLWKLNQSLRMFEMLYLIQSIVVLSSFPLCSVLARKIGHLFSWQLGVFLYLVSYALLLMLKGQSVHYYGLIGIVTGFAMSFNAIGMHIFNMDTTLDDNRDRFLNYSATLNSVAGIIGPAISGYTITGFTGIHGYYVVFLVSASMFAVAILLSIRIRQMPIHGTSHLRDILFQAPKPWRRIMNATYAWGAVDGIYNTFLVSIILFFVLKNEKWVGLFVTGQSVLAVLASVIYSRKMAQNNRQKFYLYGSLSLFLSSLFLACLPLFGVLLIQTLVSGVAQPAVGTPINSKMYEVIEKDPNFKDKRLDYIVAREIPLGIGRTLGLTLFMLLNNIWSGESFMLIALVVSTGVYLMVYPVMKGSGLKRNMKEQPLVMR